VIGGGGTEQWRFAAEKISETGQLVMSYRRPWEPNAAPARTYTAMVRVVAKR
jgi:inhibitor of cysteine peptidase